MAVSCPRCAKSYPDGTLVCAVDDAALSPELGPTLPPARSNVVLDESVRPLTGRVVGDYIIGELLGEGGMGEVYAASHAVIRKKVAVKFLKTDLAVGQDNVKRMLAEARAVSAIHHRGIVDVFHFGQLPDGRPYLVMEFLVGEPLDLYLAKRGRLDQLEAVNLLEEIAGALWAAHSAGIVHRDLKPANTFVVNDAATSSRYIKLLDFGLAKTQTVSLSLAR